MDQKGDQMGFAESALVLVGPHAVLQILFWKILVFSPVTMPSRGKKNALWGHRRPKEM